MSDIVCNHSEENANYELEHCRELLDIVSFDSKEDDDFTGQRSEDESNRLGNQFSRGGRLAEREVWRNQNYGQNGNSGQNRTSSGPSKHQDTSVEEKSWKDKLQAIPVSAGDIPSSSGNTPSPRRKLKRPMVMFYKSDEAQEKKTDKTFV